MNNLCNHVLFTLLVSFLGAHSNQMLAMNNSVNSFGLQDVFPISAAAVTLLEISQDKPVAQKNVKILGEARRVATPRHNAMRTSIAIAGLKALADKPQSAAHDSGSEFYPSTSEDDKTDSDFENNGAGSAAAAPSKKRSAAFMQSNLKKKQHTLASYNYNRDADLKIRAQVTRKGSSYVCPECAIVLKSQGSMFNHLARHTVPYSCNKCPYKTARKHTIEKNTCK